MTAGQPKREIPAPRPGGSGAPGGLRVSLMPAEAEGRRPADLGRSMVVLLIVLLAEILVIGGAYFFLAQTSASRTGQQAELRQRIQTIDAEIAEEEKSAKELATFAAQAAAAAEALDDHIYWQKFFDFLGQNTTPTVRYVNFTGDADNGQVVLDSFAISYRDMAEQIVILREHPMVRSVRATSASAQVNEVGEVSGVAFSMTVHFDPQLVRGLPAAKPAATTPAITVPAAPAPAEPAIR